jgi:hypothetical protein
MSRLCVRLSPPQSRITRGLSATGEVDPVSGAMVDPKLGHQPADRLRVSGVAGSHAADPANDVKDGALIFQGGEPAGELGRFANFDHGSYVIHRLQFRKRIVTYGLQAKPPGRERCV